MSSSALFSHLNIISFTMSIPPSPTLYPSDNVDYSTTNATRPFSMSGDGVNDVHIPSVFMQQADVSILRQALALHPVKVMLMGAKAATTNEEAKQNVQPPDSDAAKAAADTRPVSNPDPVSADTRQVSNPDPVSADTRQVSNPDPVSADTRQVSNPDDTQPVSNPDPVSSATDNAVGSTSNEGSHHRMQQDLGVSQP